MTSAKQTRPYAHAPAFFMLCVDFPLRKAESLQTRSKQVAYLARPLPVAYLLLREGYALTAKGMP